MVRWRPQVIRIPVPESSIKLTAADLADLPDDDGAGCGCDFGVESVHPWPVSVGGVFRPYGSRALGAEELEFV